MIIQRMYRFVAVARGWLPQQRSRKFARQAKLWVETLETRFAPALGLLNAFVVPVSQPADDIHVHTLADAVGRVSPGGSVTIELGASPDPEQPVNITTDGLTIQGDPRVPNSALPSYRLNILASNVTSPIFTSGP
jgi:hypothetical protein